MTLTELTPCPDPPGWLNMMRPSANDWRIMKAQKPHLRASHKSAKHRLLLRKLGYIPETDETVSTLSSDTHPKMEALQIELWRQASPTRKMNQLAQLNAAARLLALTGLRSQYPQASETELRLKLATLLLGDDLASKVYGEPEHAK